MTHSTFSFKALWVTAALALPGLAFAEAPAMTKDGFLVDHIGMTLYTFDKDKDGKSVCNEECAVNWPPLKVQGDHKAMEHWKTIKRDDGSMQWAYKDKPLYTFKDDTKAGDKTGDGKGGVWHVVKP